MTGDRELEYQVLQPIAQRIFNATSTVQIKLKDVVLFSGDKNRFKSAAKFDLCYINRRAKPTDLQTEIFASPFVPDHGTALAVLVAGMFLHFDEATSRGNIATARKGQGKDLQLTALCEFLIKAGFKPTERADGSTDWRYDVSSKTGERAEIMAELAATLDGRQWPPATPRPTDEKKPERDRRVEMRCSKGCGEKPRHRKEKAPTACFIFAHAEKTWTGSPCPVADCDGVMMPKKAAEKAAAETMTDKARKAA